jgi:hypothetical protein
MDRCVNSDFLTCEAGKANRQLRLGRAFERMVEDCELVWWLGTGRNPWQFF